MSGVRVDGAGTLPVWAARKLCEYATKVLCARCSVAGSRIWTSIPSVTAWNCCTAVRGVPCTHGHSISANSYCARGAHGAGERTASVLSVSMPASRAVSMTHW